MADIFFDDIGLLVEEINKDVIETLKKEGKNAIEDKYEEVVKESYDLHSPKHPMASRYRRGESGSLADRINFKYYVVQGNGEIVCSIYNNRVTDCQCEYCKANYPLFVDYFAEMGKAGHSRITKKPIIEETEMRLMIEDTIRNVLVSNIDYMQKL